MTWRISMIDEDNWCIRLSDEHSGFSQWGYATKDDAKRAIREFDEAHAL